MSSKYKLTYFKAMGLAEPIRYLLAYGNADFEDCRVQYENFHEMKQSMPLGQLPIVEYDGKIMYQSIATCRYLANRFKQCGPDEESALECDILVDTITDFRMHFKDVHFTDDPELKKQKKEKLVTDTAPYYLSRFEELVKKNNGYFVGECITWADLYFAAILGFMESLLKIDLLEEYPNLQSLREKVNNLPGVKEWVDTRPKTEF